MALNKINKLIQIGFLTLFTIALYWNPSFAAPTVNGAVGTIAHGESIALAGSMFGAKANAAPIKWETFDDGTLGQRISSKGWWGTEPNAAFLYANDPQRHGRSTYHARINAVQGTIGGVALKKIDQWAISRKKLVSAWMKVDFHTMGSGQLKIISMERAASHATAPGIVEHAFWCYNNECSNQNGTGTGNKVYWYQGPTLRVLKDYTYPRYNENVWQFIMFEYEESDYNTANGSSHIYKSATEGGAINKQSATGKITQTELGAVAEHVKLRAILESGAKSADVWYDDVYIDNSWQRVEIGDKPNYFDCTHREMQIPTTWQDNMIQFRFNQGSFANGATAYIFVVDNNGIPNSQGFAIQIGQPSSTTLPSTPETSTPPTAPQNLRITAI